MTQSRSSLLHDWWRWIDSWRFEVYGEAGLWHGIPYFWVRGARIYRKRG